MLADLLGRHDFSSCCDLLDVQELPEFTVWILKGALDRLGRTIEDEITTPTLSTYTFVDEAIREVQSLEDQRRAFYNRSLPPQNDKSGKPMGAPPIVMKAPPFKIPDVPLERRNTLKQEFYKNRPPWKDHPPDDWPEGDRWNGYPRKANGSPLDECPTCGMYPPSHLHELCPKKRRDWSTTRSVIHRHP